MNARELAANLHQKSTEMADGAIAKGLIHPDMRDLVTMDDLYAENYIDYLVYRAISSSAATGYAPAWCRPSIVAEQIDADGITSEMVDASIQRLSGMMVTVEMEEGSIAVPLACLYAIYVDGNGENVYFIVPHGLGASLVTHVANYAQGVTDAKSS